MPLIRKMSPGSKVLVPFINLQRPRSEAKPRPNAPDINFTTSHEFALTFLEHLRVPVDYPTGTSTRPMAGTENTITWARMTNGNTSTAGARSSASATRSSPS